MRASQWLLGLATTSAIVGAVAAGCGGSSTSGTPTKEGGADVTADVAKEAAPEAAAETGPADAPAETAACVPIDANLETFPIPDSGLPDAGINIAACVTCLRQTCQSELATCQSDCVCLDAIAGCLAGGSINLACVPAGATSDTALLELGACVETGCSSSCLPTTTGDGGGDSGGDAPSDSPSE